MFLILYTFQKKCAKTALYPAIPPNPTLTPQKTRRFRAGLHSSAHSSYLFVLFSVTSNNDAGLYHQAGMFTGEQPQRSAIYFHFLPAVYSPCHKMK